MNWKLILALSMFGLFMAFATVYFISSTAEPICWLAIFLICAVIIAKSQAPRPFVHGLAVSLVNSVWITGAHVIFYDTYLAGHSKEAQMLTGSAIPGRVLMVITGPIVGLITGCVLGLFALIASKVLRPRAAPTA